MNLPESKSLELATRTAHDEADDPSAEPGADGIPNGIAQIATIWASGCLEVACREIFAMYILNNSNSRVAGFATGKVERSPDPGMNAIPDQLKSFDEEISGQIGQFASGGIEAGLDSLVEQRNNTAHGRRSDTTTRRAYRQFEDAEQLVARIEEPFRES